ncbi:hypothetical protein INS49_012392 [Diaporthe citri]|uniref:uncharacterized protein n=1 Tax=Diaporthe citri TaxID=83186 RepID=UPI001C7E6CEC|nr:uncharacterized protein INS49_012392 [Diaporthe citri]KAG6358873.1 hypothetical protein INS49_012392 [Diaporthe citri]
MGFLDDCQPYQRFRAERGLSFPDGPTTWYCIDWDQRRHISIRVREEVTMGDDFSGCEAITAMELIFRGLSGLVDRLDDDVYLVNFSMDGDFISASSDERDDEVLTTLYCPVEMIPEAYRNLKIVVSRADLVEVDRLSPGVDLVTYRSEPGSRAVFKYDFRHYRALRNWDELNYWLRLTSEGHPSIVPFEWYRNDVEVVVGFTSAFVSSKTLQDLQKQPSWLFKKKYLEQLIDVVTHLNMDFGNVHRAIAPRNLLVNPATDTLQLFNFSRARSLFLYDPIQSQFSNTEGSDLDVKGVVATVYEIMASKE